MKSLDKYVIFSISVMLIYTVVELVLSSITGINHDTLTTCLYAAFGGEVFSCAMIKVFKLKGERNESTECGSVCDSDSEG